MIKFTEEEFNIIKKLLANGLDKPEVKRLTGRSDTTVRYVQIFDTFQDYRNHDYEKRHREAIKKPIEAIPVLPTNDSKAVTAIQSVADAINRLADILESDNPISKQAREFKLFSRKS